MSRQSDRPIDIVGPDEPAAPDSDGRGRVVIAPEVLATIVRQTVVQHSGVARLVGRSTTRRGGKGQRASSEGLHIEVDADNAIVVDLRIVVQAGMNMLEIAQALQQEISRSLTHMTGMTVREVNVHIDDVDLNAGSPDAAAAGSQPVDSRRRQN